MKKLLLSIVALFFATLLFSIDHTNEVKEGVSQDNTIELSSDKDADMVSYKL